MEYQVYCLTSLSALIEDLIIYRSLTPLDPRLPGLPELQARLDLPPGPAPRRTAPEYGRLVAQLLQAARALDRPHTSLKNLIYIGDTLFGDSTTFHHLCAGGKWTGWAFIGQDNLHYPPEIKIEGDIYQSNRWETLPKFINLIATQKCPFDESTVLVIDMDKSFIGARGRNDEAINAARIDGLGQTIAELLGPRFNRAAFWNAYHTLDQAIYHPFTTDNQDYIAYLCLMVSAGVLDLETLTRQIAEEIYPHATDCIADLNRQRNQIAITGLLDIHEEVWQGVQTGDPTPFKTFRYNEYLTTLRRFGPLPGNPTEELLTQHIVITEEIWKTALRIKEQGGLIFVISDKPDEAARPTPAQSAAGLQPLHRQKTALVGMV